MVGVVFMAEVGTNLQGSQSRCQTLILSPLYMPHTTIGLIYSIPMLLRVENSEVLDRGAIRPANFVLRLCFS